jgi:hypothetical protein
VNEYEARGRALKAFKLARVLVRLCQRFPQYDDTTLAHASTEARAKAASMAHVKAPSDATWDQALELLRVWLGPRA